MLTITVTTSMLVAPLGLFVVYGKTSQSLDQNKQRKICNVHHDNFTFVHMKQGCRTNVKLTKSLNTNNNFELDTLQKKTQPVVLVVHSSHMTHGIVAWHR